LGETLEGFAIVGPDGGFALIDVEAVVMPAEELVGLTQRNPLQLKQAVEHAVAEELAELLAASAADKVKMVRVNENSGGGEAVDVGMIGEIVAKGVDGQDDPGPALREAGLLAQPVLQGMGYEVAELSEALGLFTEGVAEEAAGEVAAA
jgi:hypothetical protein